MINLSPFTKLSLVYNAILSTTHSLIKLRQFLDAMAPTPVSGSVTVSEIDIAFSAL